MIDFDMHDAYDFLSEQEKISLIKSKIKEETEMESGVILRSGPKRNYHFMGIGQLLDEQDFITFIGLSLMMHIIKDGKKMNLADSRHLGHGLSPMKYMAELNNRESPEDRWSRYNFINRFLTLRIHPKPGYNELPRVVDVMNPEMH